MRHQQATEQELGQHHGRKELNRLELGGGECRGKQSERHTEHGVGQRQDTDQEYVTVGTESERTERERAGDGYLNERRGREGGGVTEQEVEPCEWRR